MNIQPVNISALGNMNVQNQSTHTSASEMADSQLVKTATVVQHSPPPASETPPSREELDKAVKAVTDFVNSINNSLQFSIDNDTGKSVVKVIDSSTKEVIKQFPSEEMLAIAKALDGIKGLLVHQKA